MARLPVFRRILREDILEAPPWIDRLLTPINSFFESVYTTLSGTVTFVENIRSSIRDTTFRTLSTYTGGDFDVIRFPTGIKVKAIGLIPLQIVEKTSVYTPLKQAVSIDWLDVNGEIQIFYVTGLRNSAQYLLRTLVV